MQKWKLVLVLVLILLCSFLLKLMPPLAAACCAAACGRGMAAAAQRSTLPPTPLLGLPLLLARCFFCLSFFIFVFRVAAHPPLPS